MTSRARSGIGAWLCLSAALFLAVTVSSRTDSSQLGVPVYWTWALTGVQVLALWVAGRGHAFGWIVGSVVQPGWIAYESPALPLSYSAEGVRVPSTRRGINRYHSGRLPWAVI